MFRAIVKHRKKVIIIFIVIAAVSGFLMLGVGQNYDMSKYLPKTSESKEGIDVLNEEFSYNGIAVLMLQNSGIPETLEVKKQLDKIDGIDRVVWLDDIYSLKQPLELIDEEILNNYIVGDDALLQIVFTQDDYSELTRGAIDEIKSQLGSDALIAGSAVDAYNNVNMINGSILVSILIALVIILLILFLATNSFFEVFLFLLTTGVAILLNMGTNVIFDKISYMTFASVAILQLAISMDYSIFLLHRFEQERKTQTDPAKAMVSALKASFSSILSSGMTTFVGFIALVFMSYTIGMDMGLVLAKGIVFSLIAVFLFLPALAVLSVKAIDKTKHKKILPSMKKLQHVLGGKLKFVVFALLIVLTVVSFLAQNNNTYLFSNDLGTDNSDSSAKNIIDNTFGQSNNFLVIVPNGSPAKEYEMADAFALLPKVKSVQGYYAFVDYAMPTEFVPDSVTDEFISEHYSRYILEVDVPIESEESFEMVQLIRSTTGEYYDEYYVTGASPVVYDIKTAAKRDFSRVSWLSIIFVGLILLFTFRSVSLPIILLFVIQTSIWLNMSFPYFTGTPMNFIGYMIISSVQLGATIDYAILMTNFYREGRLTLGKRQAAEYAADKAGASILVSTLVLAAAGFVVSFTFSDPVLAQLGVLIGRGALLSGGMTIIMLPQLLTLLDKIIFKTTLGGKLFKKGKHRQPRRQKG